MKRMCGLFSCIFFRISSPNGAVKTVYVVSESMFLRDATEVSLLPVRQIFRPALIEVPLFESQYTEGLKEI
jgi:hypothetical protein